MNRARIVEEILLPQLAPKEARLRQWSHILTAEFNSQGFFSRMQFFAGPRLRPFVWQVDLGPNLPEYCQKWLWGCAFSIMSNPIHLDTRAASSNSSWAQKS
jgi:hypothetical protein